MTNFTIENNQQISIAGGGICGISASYFLAKCGHTPNSITVYEKSNRWGGHSATLYLYKTPNGAIHVIARYDLDVSDSHNPKLVINLDHPAFDFFPKGDFCQDTYIDNHNGRPESKPLAVQRDDGLWCVSLQSRKVIPTETGAVVHPRNRKTHEFVWTNYGKLIHDVEGDFFNVSNFVSRSVLTDSEEVCFSKPLMGVYNPIKLLSFKYWDKEIHRLAKRIGQHELAQISMAEFIARAGGNNAFFRTIIAMSCVFDGISESVLLNQCSAKHCLDVFYSFMSPEGGRHDLYKSTFGISVVDEEIRQLAKQSGVNFIKNVGAKTYTGATLYTMHPWENSALDIHSQFDCVQSVPVYIIDRPLYPAKQTARFVNCGDQYGQFDISKYVQNYANFKAYSVYGVAGQDHVYENKIKALKGKNERIIHIRDYQGQSLDNVTLKMEWAHGVVTPKFESLRKKILTDYQGSDTKWHASACLVGDLKHEAAISSALDAVIMMKGEAAYKQLTQLGFRPNLALDDFRKHWAKTRSKTNESQLLAEPV